VSQFSALLDRSNSARERADVVIVTPELAAEWLSLNHVNRRLRQRQVELYMSLIKSNEWRVGEPIHFEGYLDDGTAQLVNGQHRLTAIIRTETAVPVLVVQGVQRGSQVYLDTGARRNLGDVLRMERDVSDPSGLAPIIRLGFLYDAGRIMETYTGGGGNAVTNGELLSWYDRNAGGMDVVLASGRRVRREQNGNMPAGSVARLLFDRLDADQADVFFDDLCSGVGLLSGDPVLAMRSWYTTRPARAARLIRSTFQLALLIKTWNARRLGNPMKIATFHPFDTGGTGKRGRELFPVPI
jgi:hypothetical protein